MSSRPPAPSRPDHLRHPGRPPRPRLGFFGWWFLGSSLLSGLFALAWLILRSGPRPSRLSYPCQQAALSTASLAFAAPLVAAVVAARRALASGLRTRTGMAAATLGLVGTVAAWGYLTHADAMTSPRLDPPPDYRAQVFHVADCPQQPDGDRFVGLDWLLDLMGRNGLKIYRSAVETDLSGPDGVVGSDDVVVLKINYQWEARGGTNVDLLRGLIRVIVDHPDGFTGEVVVCENGQSVSILGFDRSSNNAEDRELSPHDVVVAFQGQGWSVSHYDWGAVRFEEVDEFSDGDSRDGYVILDRTVGAGIPVTYPKFQTDYGTRVSLRHGVWDSGRSSYDRERFTLINLPVLKPHGAVYAVTGCVKNYMGVVTNELAGSHTGVRRGLMGAVMAEIGPADLHIMDCIWTNTNPTDGPWTNYAIATRNDELVASTDPVAADIWAVTHILIPTFLAAGHSPPWPNPSADPEDPDGTFRRYLDASMNELLASGYAVTNNLEAIDAFHSGGPDPQGQPRRVRGRWR